MDFLVLLLWPKISTFANFVVESNVLAAILFRNVELIDPEPAKLTGTDEEGNEWVETVSRYDEVAW